MTNKYNVENMINRSVESTGKIKSVLFLFLGLLLSITVKSQCPIIDSAIISPVSCHAGSDGEIDLVLLNPSGNYNFLWNTTATGEDIANLPSGTYNVTITDIANPACFSQDTFIITQPQTPLSTAATPDQNVVCYGDSTGSADASAIGGTEPYTYLWSNGETTHDPDSLWGDPNGTGPGFGFTHTVTVTDSNFCTAQDSINIYNSYPAITGIIDIFSDSLYGTSISCFGACDAEVAFSSGGGAPSHKYTWSTFPQQVYGPGSGPDTATGLCFGGYFILVEDALGCRDTFLFNITQPDELFANAEMVQHVQCYGFDDGMALATATQGTLDYTFAWDSINGYTGIDTTGIITGNLIDSLTPGVHTVYITDGNGCTASDTVVITEPTLLEVDIIDSLAVYAYCSNTNSGELCAVASGGTPNYSYAWNDGNPGQSTPCAYNLQADQYTITVTDDRYCIASDSFDLDSITNSMNEDSVVFIEDSVSCFGLYDGALTATNVVGGVAPYNYNWNGPGTYTGVDSNITSLYAGSYSVFISDFNGCQMTIGTYLHEPDQLEYDIYNTVDETCLGAENGQIWVHVNGGTSPYYYDSSESNSFPIPSVNQVPIINDSLIFNLASGTHSIYITDNNNCEGAVTWGAGTGGWQRYIYTLDTVPTPVVTVINGTTTCYNIDDGEAEVDSIFLLDNPLYTYTWEENVPPAPGAPNGIDISNGADTSWGAFSPGVYWLVAHYADSASFGIPYSGCDNAISFTILAAQPEINIVTTIDNVSCYSYNNGQIDLDISGGWGAPYQLTWDTTSAYPSGFTDNTNNLSSLDDLTVGTYTVSISDINGCITISDPFEVAEPLPLISDIIATHVSCFGQDDGEATLIPVNNTGTPSYTYLWTHNGETDSIIIDLVAGTYTVTVTDDQGCSYTDTVVISEPADPIVFVEVDSLYHGTDDVSCWGASDASANATGSGIDFWWFAYDISSQMLIDPSDTLFDGQHTDPILGVGAYIVISADANGCVDTSESITITEPDSLYIDSIFESNPSSTYHISCFGDNDGWAKVEIVGGYEAANVYGYNIYWDFLPSSGPTTIHGDGTDSIYGLSAGYRYIVSVTDANGCEAIDDTTNLYTEPIEFTANVSTLNYPGPLHGPVNISFIDSTISVEPYSFEWSPDPPIDISFTGGVISSDYQIFIHEFLEAELDTNYVFVVLTNDVTGCQSSEEFIIEVQGMPEVKNVFTPNGDEWNAEFSFSEYAMESVDVQIFNRWGQLVKSWIGSDKSWDGTGIDGKDLPEGVYFYVFVGQGVDGYHYNKKGTVTLLR